MNDKMQNKIGIVYLLKCNKTGKQYVGSSTNFKKRKNAHKNSYTHFLKGKYNYVSSFEIIKNGDYSYKILAEIECVDKIILKKVEQQYITRMDCINKLQAYTDRKQYKKEWDMKNKKHIQEYNIAYQKRKKEEQETK